MFRTKTSTVLNFLYKTKKLLDINFWYVKKLYSDRPTKNFQQFVLEFSRVMQVSKLRFFLLTTKSVSHDSLVNFESKFYTVGKFVWEINKHIKKLFIALFLFFQRWTTLLNGVDELAESWHFFANLCLRRLHCENQSVYVGLTVFDYIHT